MRLSSAFGKPASIATRIRVTDEIDIVANLPEGQAPHEMEIVEKLGALPSRLAGRAKRKSVSRGCHCPIRPRRAFEERPSFDGLWGQLPPQGERAASRDLCPD